MYLNLGLVGLLLMFSMILAGYRKARRQMLIIPSSDDDDTAISIGLAEYKLGFILALVGYNVTDATFKALHPNFFTFFLVSLEYSAAFAVATVPGFAHRAVEGTRREAVPQARIPAPVHRWTGHAHPVRPRSVRLS
jgi:hypothetical protein